MKIKQNKETLKLAKSVLNIMQRLAAITLIISLPVEIIGFYIVYETFLAKLGFSIFMTITISLLFAVIIICTKLIKEIDNSISALKKNIDSLENKLDNN